MQSTTTQTLDDASVSQGSAPTIRIAWWNTSLAPLSKRRDTPRDLQIAEDIVAALIQDESVDFLALGEVNNELLLHFKENLKERLGIADLDVCSGPRPDRMLDCDIGILFRKSQLDLIETRAIRHEYARGALRIAVRFDMEIAGGSLPIHFFAVHWPSRIYCHENMPKRNELGMRLYDSTRELTFESPQPPQIVLLGDFNDDPSDVSLAGHLLATRDRGLARKSPQYFYNPFWRHLGESHPHIPGTRCNSVAGTCFYPKGDQTRWSTFDQIIVSSALVKGSEWELREDHTRIWRCDLLDGEIRSSSSIFDHFPVIASLESKQ